MSIVPIPFTDAELFDLITRIIEDESRTKSYSIEMIRKLLSQNPDYRFISDDGTFNEQEYDHFEEESN